MSRFRVVLVVAVVTVAGLAATASSAGAQEGDPNAPSNENASCIGVLSSFVGADPLAPIVAPGMSRSDFAGQEDFEGTPGQSIKEVAQLKSLLDSGDIIIPGLPPVGTAILSCSGQAGLP
jgi:hypothetical protein